MTGHVVSDCKARAVFEDETSNKSGDIVLALTEKSAVARTKRVKNKKKNLQGKAALADNASEKTQVSTYTGGFLLAANDAINIDRGDRILDSCASRHLVYDESLFIDSTVCVHEKSMTDGESLRLTRVGNVRLEVLARGRKKNVTLTEVYIAPRLAKYIFS